MFFPIVRSFFVWNLWLSLWWWIIVAYENVMRLKPTKSLATMWTTHCFAFKWFCIFRWPNSFFTKKNRFFSSLRRFVFVSSLLLLVFAFKYMRARERENRFTCLSNYIWAFHQYGLLVYRFLSLVASSLSLPLLLFAFSFCERRLSHQIR